MIENGTIYTLSKTMKSFQWYLQNDADYAWTWHCNLVMVAVDSGAEHLYANKQTAQFLKRTFEVDITQTKMYQSIMEAYNE